jgi:hypothetical protein
VERGQRRSNGGIVQIAFVNLAIDMFEMAHSLGHGHVHQSPSQHIGAILHLGSFHGVLHLSVHIFHHSPRDSDAMLARKADRP